MALRRLPLTLVLALLALLALTCDLPGAGMLQGTAVSLLQTGTVSLGTVQALTTEMMGTAMVGAEGTLSAVLTQAATPPAPAAATPPPPAVSASISGTLQLAHPAGPGLRVYAREITGGKVHWVETADGATTYTIPDLPPGTYEVFAWFYPQGESGAYTSVTTIAAQTSAEQAACTQSLVQIPLAAGQAFAGADIRCWGGDFFALATPVP